ncbi:MAG: SDR family NAD(P)-dependent oxidoreductase [Bacteroides sp.]|nr:SDR family NAD(P)-dependent oxidoreductase [Bacteroides sp.]
MDKKIVITGATSGLGRSLAERFVAEGWRVGAAGRNARALAELSRLAPGRVITSEIDVCREDAPERLRKLAEALGGMDIYLHCPGILLENPKLEVTPEVRIAETNAIGMARMTAEAFRWFEETGQPGRLVAISSVAGCRGLGAMPAYSASKAFCQTYLEGLRQRADELKLPLRVVDIRPGWTRTPLLDPSRSYMLEMDSGRVTPMIFKAVLRAKRVATIGLRWRVLTFFERLVPGAVWQRLHLPLWKDSE